MTRSELVTLTRDLIHEPENTAILTDTQVVSFLNARYDYVNSLIIKANENYFLTQDATLDLVNGTDSYAFPDLDDDGGPNFLKIKRVEIAYDATNFVTALPIDVQQLPDSNFVSATYTTQNPRYYISGNQLTFLPTPTANATNAVKIWYIQQQDELTGDSSVPVFPRQYHYILAYGAAADVKLREGAVVVDTDDVPFIDRLERKFQDGVRNLIETISNRTDSHPRVVTVAREYGVSGPEDTVLPGSVTA